MSIEEFNTKINDTLNEIYESNIYILKEERNFKTPEDYAKYIELINYMINHLGLIYQTFSNATITSLTPKGRKVHRLGGWIEYLKLEEIKEKKKEKKEKYDLDISWFQSKTKWLPLILSISSLILSIIALTKKEHKSDKEKLYSTEKHINSSTNSIENEKAEDMDTFHLKNQGNSK
ncbi:hypothetical protein GZ212_12475 [Mangrovimonas sp. CR14]|uniref:hypothetical protein n=1 Tax=Mangrovimonas sp. CR14 TaxID=2706120 RepID=UPI001423BCA2|nr:hypothetical protein [Mangrovimonas sp. CR14]NIK92970.1 hypothetical protein [Mangrovimonas sp. CR14]